MIELFRVGKTYHSDKTPIVALDNISLTIKEGEFISVMGPSGCGKSTLLNIIGLLDEPSRGKLSLAGQTIYSYQDKLLAKMRNEMIGFIFQSFHLINDLSVLDNVEIPLLYRKLSRKSRKQMALEALSLVGLSDQADRSPSHLSGGQQQRVAIARAIAGKPKLLLADEPTGNLDTQMSGEIMDILTELNQQHNTTIMMVTHDVDEAKRTQSIIRLRDGLLLNEGIR